MVSTQRFVMRIRLSDGSFSYLPEARGRSLAELLRPIPLSEAYIFQTHQDAEESRERQRIIRAALGGSAPEAEIVPLDQAALDDGH